MTDSIADLKRQLQQLDELSRSGALPAEAAAPARADLERRLLDAVMAAPEAGGSPSGRPESAVTEAPVRPARPSIKLLLGLTAYVVIFVGAGMVLRANSVGAGAAGAMAGAQAEAAVAGAEVAGGPNAATMAQIETMLGKLVERLKSQPDDADGWLMLGRSYSVLGRYGEAVSAYRKVLALKPKDGQAMADLADALAMSQNRNFAGEPQKLIDQALALDPENLKALALAGTIAFEAKDYPTTMKHFERILKVGPSDNDLVEQVRDNLIEVRKVAGLPPDPSLSTPLSPAAALAVPPNLAVAPGGGVAAGAGSPAGAAQGASVSGTVELAPTLAAKAAPDDTVFIFARPAEGARMPLAILKKRVRDLPFAFTLDDSLAMSPAARLSMASAVVVGARVSKSGQAMPQPGDLQGLSASVKPGASGLKIVIGEEVR